MLELPALLEAGDEAVPATVGTGAMLLLAVLLLAGTPVDEAPALASGMATLLPLGLAGGLAVEGDAVGMTGGSGLPAVRLNEAAAVSCAWFGVPVLMLAGSLAPEPALPSSGCVEPTAVLLPEGLPAADAAAAADSLLGLSPPALASGLTSAEGTCGRLGGVAAGNLVMWWCVDAPLLSPASRLPGLSVAPDSVDLATL